VTVVFFISGHGFGHASREVEIINALIAAAPSLRVLIRTAVSPSLMARTLRVPYTLRPGACDSGIVQSSSVAHDDAATIELAAEFYSTFDARVADETRQLANDDVTLIVGDIPPLAFEVAAGWECRRSRSGISRGIGSTKRSRDSLRSTASCR
jgi:hypothetical protein